MRADQPCRSYNINKLESLQGGKGEFTELVVWLPCLISAQGINTHLAFLLRNSKKDIAVLD